MFGFIESVDFVHVRSAKQSAIQIVGPGMVRALDRLVQPAAFYLAEPRPAMAADIVETTDFALLIPQNDETFARRVRGKIIPTGRDLILVPHAQPLRGKDTLLFFRKNLR